MKQLHQRGQTTYGGRSPIGEAILKGEDFKSGAMSGVRFNSPAWHGGTGHLDWQAVQLLRDDNPSYVVYSYATPIAWFTPGSAGEAPIREPYWTVPDRKYSVTTTRHQSIVRRALASMGLSYEE